MKGRYILALAAIVTAVVCPSASATVFNIVDNNSRAVVVIPPDPTQAESFAALELVRYVKLMSGVDLEISATKDVPAGAIAISKAGRFPGESPNLGDEGYAFVKRGDRLYITGAEDRSVLYAVYDLLERLGCRWLTPNFRHYNGKSEVVPKKVSIPIYLAGNFIEKPKLKYRKLYVEEGLSHTEENLLQLVDWMGKSRFNTLVVPTNYQNHGRVKWDNWRKKLTPELRKRDIQIEVGGHGYQNYLNAEMEDGKLFEQHPEWFGMDEKGARTRQHRYTFCTSNADAVEYLTKNVIAYLKGRPEIDIFDFWPPDGDIWCSCEACKKLGSPADRQARLVRHVISKVKDQGIDTRFECIAYSEYTDPPKNPEMPEQVLIDFCPINQCFEAQIYDASSERNAGYVVDYQAWRNDFRGDISVYSYYRKYAWRSLPVIIPHYMQEDLRWYLAQGADGVSSYAEPGDWQTYELNHYTFARLAWNKDADVDGIIKDFCTHRYGKAAGAAAAAYQTMEETVRRYCSIPFTKRKSAEETGRALERLQSAKKRLENAGETELTRGLMLSLDYALLDLALQKSIALKEDKSIRVKMVDELSSFLDQHKDDGIVIMRVRLSRDGLLKEYQAD